MSRMMRKPPRLHYSGRNIAHEEIVGVWLEKEFTVSGRIDREGQIVGFKVWFRGIEITAAMHEDEIRNLKIILLEEYDIRIAGETENKERGAV